jgi:hypothetical protein
VTGQAPASGPLERKLHELDHEADVGESDKTPLILIGGVWVVCAIAVAVTLGIVALAFVLAS